MDLKRMLWPTDLSGSAKFALKYVQSLTEKYGAEVHVLHVIHDIAHHRGLYGNFEPGHIDRIIAWENDKAKERLDHVCAEHLHGCPLYVKHVAIGDPAQMILRCIDENDIDMVIMAAKGAGGFFQFGSVTEKVVKNSPVPVVVVPSGGQPVEYNQAMVA